MLSLPLTIEQMVSAHHLELESTLQLTAELLDPSAPCTMLHYSFPITHTQVIQHLGPRLRCKPAPELCAKMKMPTEKDKQVRKASKTTA